jgi:hypothetical protein
MKTKPYEEFNNSKTAKDGKSSYCKICGTEYSREYHKNTYVRKFPKEKFLDGKRYCTMCKDYKNLEDFNKNNMSWCSNCRSEHARKKYDNHRVYPRKMLDGKYNCRHCGEYFKEEEMHLARSNSNYPGRTFCKDCYGVSKRLRLVRSHGLTDELYLQTLKDQNYSCKICGGKETSFRQRLSIDHDHAHCSGEKGCAKCFRGLLCSSCNVTLGNAKDSVDILQNMIEYLKNFDKQKTYRL